MSLRLFMNCVLHWFPTSKNIFFKKIIKYFPSLLFIKSGENKLIFVFFLNRSTDLSPDLLTKWYKWRACEIERQCGIVDYAVGLINIGKDRNIIDLENLLFELETLDDLVYKVGLEFLSLSEVRKLTDLEKVKLLMSKSSESKFVDDLKDKVLPFIKRKEKYFVRTEFNLQFSIFLSFNLISNSNLI